MKKFLLSIVIAISILTSITAVAYNLLHSSNALTIIAGDDDPANPNPDPDYDYYLGVPNVSS
ncbi:MAG: hypothetical protein IJK13_00135 [Lachnospiraceae bacterium]|nr:hypothetical protein [Lachnospiraceae bacterium]